jgi:hypothetical protein
MDGHVDRPGDRQVLVLAVYQSRSLLSVIGTLASRVPYR